MRVLNNLFESLNLIGMLIVMLCIKLCLFYRFFSLRVNLHPLLHWFFNKSFQSVLIGWTSTAYKISIFQNNMSYWMSNWLITNVLYLISLMLNQVICISYTVSIKLNCLLACWFSIYILETLSNAIIVSMHRNPCLPIN